MFFLAGHPDWEVGNTYFQKQLHLRKSAQKGEDTPYLPLREVGSATDLSKPMALNQWGMVFELI